MSGTVSEQAAVMARANDAFRRSGQGVMVTVGAQGLPNVMGLLQAVRAYDRFGHGNDPYGEHDFGSIVWEGEKVFWKIDYYDQALEGWADPRSAACRRVLTVMLAGEY